MTFEEKIIKNSSIRQKNLVRPAKIAFEKPDTGVTINKKGAYYLIKDSAEITIKYVGRSKEEQQTKQLLNIILTDIGVVNNNFTSETKEDLDLTINDEIDDVYGDYELEDSDSTSSSSSTTSTETIDVNDASGIIQKLIEVFQAKS